MPYRIATYDIKEFAKQIKENFGYENFTIDDLKKVFTDKYSRRMIDVIRKGVYRGIFRVVGSKRNKYSRYMNIYKLS